MVEILAAGARSTCRLAAFQALDTAAVEVEPDTAAAHIAGQGSYLPVQTVADYKIAEDN